jgi:hypothetical protein
VADATSSSDPLASDYAAIGADIGLAATDTDNLALLNDIVGASQTSDVDSVADLNNLARIANAIQATAATLSKAIGQTVTDADFQAAMRLVKFNNTSDAPNTTARTITFTATDGSATSSTFLTETVNVVAVKDPPTLSVSTSTAPYANNRGAQAVFSNAAISAVDAGQTITGLKFTVTNLDDSVNEKITVDGTEFSLTDATNGTSTTNSVGYKVSVTGTTATVTLSKPAGLSELEAQTLVNAIAYRHDISAGMHGDRVVTLTEITDSGDGVTALAWASTLQDKTVTAAPAAGTVTISNDTGINTTDRITNDSAVRVSLTLGSSLTLAADEKLQVSANNGTTWVDTTGLGTDWATAVNAVTLSSGASRSITARIRDTSGNTSAVMLADNSYTLDTVATVSISASNSPGWSARAPVTFTYRFNEPVTGFDESKVIVSGGTKGAFTQETDATYTLVVTPLANSTDSIMLETLTTGVTDAAGNVVKKPSNHSQSVDTVAPTVERVSVTAQDASGTSLDDGRVLKHGDVVRVAATYREHVLSESNFPAIAILRIGTEEDIKMTPVITTGQTLTWTYTISSAGTPDLGLIRLVGQSLLSNVSDRSGNWATGTLSDSNFVSADTVAPTAQIDLVQSVLANTPGLTYSYSTGSFYRLTSGINSWEIANTNAANSVLFGYAGHLVHVNSQAEQDYVIGSHAYNGGFGWIGGSDKVTEGTWQWHFGANAGEIFYSGGAAVAGTYTNWQPAQPDSTGGAAPVNYAYVRAVTLGPWADWGVELTGAPSLIEWEGSKLLNQQQYNNTQSIRIKSTEAGTAYLVNANQTVGTVADFNGLDGAQWNSASLADPSTTVLSSEDFATGTPTGWSTNTATDLGGVLGRFLGRFGGNSDGSQAVFKTYDFGENRAGQTVEINFDMIEMDSWNGELFKVFINNAESSVQSYWFTSNQIRDGGIDVGDLSNGANEGFNGSAYTEEVHHYTLRAVLDTDGRVTLGFGAKLDQAVSDESFGIDNVVITTDVSATELQLTGLTTGTYKLYTADAAGNLSAAALDTVKVLPIVIDLNRDGALNYGNVVMDVNGDGLLDATKWAGALDGVLIWDKYGDGQVHDHSQYAFAQYDTTSSAQGKTATDLSGLADAFDSNHDGVFDARDAQFADFSVWQDVNQNGVSDAGEVKTLADLGLASLNLTSDGVARSPVAGVFEAGQTQWTTIDGTQLLVADVGFEFSTLPVLDMRADAVWHNSTAQALIDQHLVAAGGVMLA